jgi:hypothetical protein
VIAVRIRWLFASRNCYSRDVSGKLWFAPQFGERRRELVQNTCRFKGLPLLSSTGMFLSVYTVTWSTVFLVKPINPSFYATQRFITVFTRGLTVPFPEPGYFSPYVLSYSSVSVLMLSTCPLPQLLPNSVQGFLNNIFHAFLVLLDLITLIVVIAEYFL